EINQYLCTYMHDQQSQWSKWIKVTQFVWNNTVSAVTNDSHFGITRSYPPKMGIEPLDTKAPTVKDFAALFRKVVAASEKAKESMKLQMDKHRLPTPNYQVGQQVWLSTDHLHMLNRPSKKLTEKWIGPYEVLRVAPNAVELKLPKSLKIHPVVNVSQVKPYLGALPGQPTLWPGPIHVTEERDKEYEVEQIVDSRHYKGQYQYLSQ